MSTFDRRGRRESRLPRIFLTPLKTRVSVPDCFGNVCNHRRLPGGEILRLTYIVAVMLALSFAGFAQTVGQITGVVTDPGGSIVVGATITITNSQTNAARTTTTNGAGNYVFPALQPGVYNVKAEMP